MGHDHAQHAPSHIRGANEPALRWALLLTTLFLVTEAVGGNSVRR